MTMPFGTLPHCLLLLVTSSTSIQGISLGQESRRVGTALTTFGPPLSNRYFFYDQWALRLSIQSLDQAKAHFKGANHNEASSEDTIGWLSSLRIVDECGDHGDDYEPR